MMQYLLPRATHHSWSPRRAAKTDREPFLPSPTKINILAIDKTRLSGGKRGKRDGNHVHDVYGGEGLASLESSHLSRSISLGGSHRAEGGLAALSSSARFSKSYSKPGNAKNRSAPEPELFSASDLQQLLKGSRGGAV